MWVCNTGLDCSECLGCETQLEYDENLYENMDEMFGVDNAS